TLHLLLIHFIYSVSAYHRALHSFPTRRSSDLERQLQQLIDVTVTYSQSGKVENALREANYMIQEIVYTENITYQCVIPLENKEKFIEDVTNWTSAQAEIEIDQQAWIEIPIDK